LTRKRYVRKVEYDFYWDLRKYLESVGYVPTRREIAEKLGCKKTWASQQIRNLVKKGWLRDDRKRRCAIEIVK
jgi:DNA-binding MarR family transcriptional regulator